MNVISLIMNVKGLYENIIIELNTKWVINREIKTIVVYKNYVITSYNYGTVHCS